MLNCVQPRIEREKLIYSLSEEMQKKTKATLQSPASVPGVVCALEMNSMCL